MSYSGEFRGLAEAVRVHVADLVAEETALVERLFLAYPWATHAVSTYTHEWGSQPRIRIDARAYGSMPAELLRGARLWGRKVPSEA